MALEFLDEYFGLTRQHVTPTEKMLFLNETNEITRSLAEAIVTADVADSQAVYEKAMRRAKQSFLRDFLAAVGQHFDYTTVAGSAQVGMAVEPVESVPTDTTLGGVLITVENSRWLSLRVNNIKTYRSAGGGDEGSLRIYDATTGRNLWTSQEAATAGWSTVKVGETFPIQGQTRHYLLLRENTDEGTIKTAIKPYWWNDCGCSATYGSVFAVRGATVDSSLAKTRENCELDNETHGLIVDFSVVCDRQMLMLNYLEDFLPVFFECLAIEFIRVVGESQNINSHTLSYDREAVNELLYGKSGKFAGDKVPGLVEQYQQHLSNTCKGIQRDAGDGICFECNAPIKFTTQLP